VFSISGLPLIKGGNSPVGGGEAKSARGHCHV
jgi:hypothetical protein